MAEIEGPESVSEVGDREGTGVRLQEQREEVDRAREMILK